MAGISSVGWALPSLAIKAEEARKATGLWSARGLTEKTVASFDEDEATLGVEAGALAMAARGYHGGRIAYLAFASVGAPAGTAALARLALDIPRGPAVDFRGGGPPFAAALLAAIQTAETTGGACLVIAADALRARPEDPADNALGAGAAAFLVEKHAQLQVLGAGAATVPALELARLGPDGLVRSYQGDDPSPAALRMALADLFLAGATSEGDRGLSGFRAESFDRAAGPERGGPMLALHSPHPLRPEVMAPSLWARTGDTGAASAALSLLSSLEGAEPDDQLLLADAEGASGAALAIKVADRPKGVEGFHDSVALGRTHLSWGSYLGHRRYLPDALPTHTKSEGAYVSPASWEETLQARLTLVASRCTACGAVRHPPRDVCPDCGGSAPQTFHARPEGAVHAFTRIGRGGAPSEFAVQQSLVGEYAVATLDMADGFRMVAQVSGSDPRSLKVGDDVRLALRRLFEQEGRIRYGLKAIPLGQVPRT